jgi:hypothetical protein
MCGRIVSSLTGIGHGWKMMSGTGSGVRATACTYAMTHAACYSATWNKSKPDNPATATQILKKQCSTGYFRKQAQKHPEWAFWKYHVNFWQDTFRA